MNFLKKILSFKRSPKTLTLEDLNNKYAKFTDQIIAETMTEFPDFTYVSGYYSIETSKLTSNVKASVQLYFQNIDGEWKEVANERNFDFQHFSPSSKLQLSNDPSMKFEVIANDVSSNQTSTH